MQISELTSREIGPLKVGGIYFSGYWQQNYEVLHIGIGHASRICSSPWSATIRWADGRESTHCTAWDSRRDQVVRQPEGVTHG